MRNFLFLALCVVGWMTTEAQQISTDTLTWNVDGLIDVVTQTETSYTCQFTTLASSSVDWAQKAGAKVYQFTVSSTEGTWSDISSDGQFTYYVNFHSYSGSLVFARSSGETTIWLTLNADGQQGINEKFIVTTQP
jgi:hypothetical protein